LIGSTVRLKPDTTYVTALSEYVRSVRLQADRTSSRRALVRRTLIGSTVRLKPDAMYVTALSE